MVSAVFRSGGGGRIGGCCGAEVRGGPAAAPCRGRNQQVSRSAAGEGLPGAPPSPTRRTLGPGGTGDSSAGCPRQREAQPAAEGVSPTFVPWRNAAGLCPLPLLQRNPPWQVGLAGVVGDAAGSRLSCACWSPSSGLLGLPPGRVGEIGWANTFLEKTECSQLSSA